MNKSNFENFIEMLNKAELEYTISPKRKYVVFEDQECMSIIMAEFDIDENLINISSYHDFNSLDEVQNLWQNF